MKLGWDDIKTVHALVRGGSLAAAATELGVNYTTVARRIQRAEDTLGLKLFERLADGYAPTDTARLVAEHAAKMEAEEHSLMRQLAGRDGRLSGKLTVTAPQLLIAHLLAPMLETFVKQHPEVDLRVPATNDILDLSRREADLAVRISREPGDTLKGLRLARQHTASFATQGWADRIAADPSAPIDWILYDAYPRLPDIVTARYPSSRVRYRFDDMVAILGAAQSGLGLARLPMFLGRVTPGLVQVPVLPPQPYADIWVVGHADVWPSAKVRAFRDCLVPHLRARRDLFVGEGDLSTSPQVG
ncbi:MAG: LysR family transcriptional regulator [Rhodobacteraceae bacterium]|nr:LysR family transcriptional regulator [Paracoccaceae bacterium]